MSAHRSRKGYRPKPVHANALQRAIEGARRLPAVDVASIKQGLTLSLTAFGRGIACDRHWRAMADALNVAESLSTFGIGSDEATRDHIATAQAALAAVMQRNQAGGNWTLYPAERNALDTALWLHGVQLDHACFREYEAAIERTRNRIAGARAGSPPRGAIVIEGDIAP